MAGLLRLRTSIDQGPGGRCTTVIQVTTHAATAAAAMVAMAKNQRSPIQNGFDAPSGRVRQGRASRAMPRRAVSERPYRATTTRATRTHSRGPGKNPQSHPIRIGSIMREGAWRRGGTEVRRAGCVLVTNRIREGRQIGTDRGRRLDRDDARRVSAFHPIAPPPTVNHNPATVRGIGCSSRFWPGSEEEPNLWENGESRPRRAVGGFRRAPPFYKKPGTERFEIEKAPQPFLGEIGRGIVRKKSQGKAESNYLGDT